METQLSIDSTQYDYFLLRIVLGAFIGVIYLTSVILCLQSSCNSCSGRGMRLAYESNASICGCFTIATIVLLSLATISIELCCVSLTLIYSLIALNLSQASWLFGDDAEQREHKRLRRREEAFFVAAETVAVDVRPSNARTHHAFNLVVGKQTRPLIYLTGAKLLTIFCFFVPFICIASRITIQANSLFDNNDDSGFKNNITSANVDDVSNSIDGSSNTSDDMSTANHKIFTDLMVLLSTRIALGFIAILLVRHNVNQLSIMCMMPMAIAYAIVLLVPLFELPSHPFTVQTITFGMIMIMYVAFSLVVDIIGHHAVLYAHETVCHSYAVAATPKVISLTFATFIEHLIDICIVVVYLNDWISAKLIGTSFAIIFLTMIFSQKSTDGGGRPQSSNLITVKYQIL